MLIMNGIKANIFLYCKVMSLQFLKARKPIGSSKLTEKFDWKPTNEKYKKVWVFWKKSLLYAFKHSRTTRKRSIWMAKMTWTKKSCKKTTIEAVFSKWFVAEVSRLSIRWMESCLLLWLLLLESSFGCWRVHRPKYFKFQRFYSRKKSFWLPQGW